MSLTDLPPFRFERNLPKFDREEARRLRSDGMSFATIAARLGVSRKSISNACKGMPAPVIVTRSRGKVGKERVHDYFIDTARRLHDDEGMTFAEIGAKLGVSGSAAHRWVMTARRRSRDGDAATDPDTAGMPASPHALAMARSLYAEGLPATKVARRLGVSHGTARRWLRAADVELVRGRRTCDWDEVMRLAAEGLTQVAIAERLGMSKNNVWVILRKSRARPAASPAAASSPVPGGSGTPGT